MEEDGPSTEAASISIDEKGDDEDRLLSSSGSLSGRYERASHDPSVPLVVSGPIMSFLVEKNDLQALKWLVPRTQVFARMSPTDKQNVIRVLQHLGYIVGMVGDGANDCGALKQADVGLALSASEASLASPFSSSETDVKPTMSLVKEGRNSMTISFQAFKFMALYSVIQTCTTLITSVNGLMLSDGQYLFLDLFLVLPLGFTFLMSPAANKLAAERPNAQLISWATLIPILLQCLLMCGVQVVCYYYTLRQDFYTKSPLESRISFESTTLVYVSMFQYIFVCLAFSTLSPFQASLTKNPFYVILVLIDIIICSVLMFTEPGW